MYATLCLYTIFILCYNLNDKYLWPDEAETANLAISITKFGLPRAYDGKNYISLYGPSVFENESHIVTWRPWLDEYIAAASFKILGQTTAAGRFPFALIGVATVFLTTLLAYRIFNSHRAALTAALFIATSEMFVLHARQCRYYSLVIFAEVCLIFAVYLIMAGKKPKGIIVLTLSMAIQFYTNYIVLAGNIFALWIFALFTEKRNTGMIFSVFVSSAVFTLMALPWLVYAKPWHQSSYIGHGEFMTKFKFYLAEIHFHFFSFFLFLIPLAYYMHRRLTIKDRYAAMSKVSTVQSDLAFLLLLTIPLNLLIVPLAPGIYVRYMVHLIPNFVLLTVFILTTYVSSAWLRVSLICLLCFTNFISYVSAWPVRILNDVVVTLHEPRATVLSLVNVIKTDSLNRLEDTVKYLRKKGNPGDTILVSCPEFPLMFYTGMQVINARFLDSVNFTSLPNWILTECVTEETNVAPLYPPPDYAVYYRPLIIDIHDGPTIGNMPNPDIYEQFTAKNRGHITVYKLQPAVQISAIPDKSVFKPVGSDGSVTSVNVSPDCKYAAIVYGRDKIIETTFNIKLVDIKSGNLAGEFSLGDRSIRSAYITTDSKYILGIAGNTVRKWNIETGKRVKIFAGHRDHINAIALTPDGKHMLSAAKNDTLKLWDIVTGREIMAFIGPKNNTQTIAITSDGLLAASAGMDNILRLWNIGTGTEIKIFSGNAHNIKTIAISKSAKFMLTGGGYDGVIRMWDIAQGRETGVLLGHSNAVTAIVITPDDRYALSGGISQRLRLWDLTNGKEKIVFPPDVLSVSSLSLTADGKLVVVGSWDGTASIWDVASGKKLRTYDGNFKKSS
ncbi:MAG: glycosyltransferase family 39 protein [Nitrospirae bacterium YQR-1]